VKREVYAPELVGVKDKANKYLYSQECATRYAHKANNRAIMVDNEHGIK
jgi:hypothetical protein